MTASNVDFSRIPEFHVELVRDRNIQYPDVRNGSKVWRADTAAAILHTMLDKSPVEQFVVLYVDHQGYISGAEKVGLGGVGSVGVDMRDIFRGAVVAGVPDVIIGHNHTLNDVTPSDQDLTFTAIAIQAASALNIHILDHIVVSPFGKHYSIWDHQEEMSRRTSLMAVQNALRDLLKTDHPLVNPFLPPAAKEHHHKDDLDIFKNMMFKTLKNRG